MHTQALIFIQDLAAIMLTAGITTVLCHRFKQPLVLGYIIAGILLSPHNLPISFVKDEHVIKTLGDLGVIFLMFSLGLEFNLSRLAKVGITSFIAAIIEILLMTWLGFEIGALFNWSFMDSIFLGAMLAISSTMIIVKALEEQGLKNQTFAQLIFGILIIEDIFAIAILALLSSIAKIGFLSVEEVLLTTGQLASFLVISLVLGILIIPKLVAYIAKFKNDEILLIFVLGLCFGFCLVVIQLDYSIALGAFIIGAIIAESTQHKEIELRILPLRDMFSAIFFVTVGLLFNYKIFIDFYLPIFIIVFAVIFGKIITGAIGILISGHQGKTAMKVGMGLAQIGEFSFIIASVGIASNITGEFLFSIAVSVSIVTTLLTPYLIKYSDLFSSFITYLVPNKITNNFNSYSAWLKKINIKSQQSEIRMEVYSNLLQIIINLLIVMAIFFGIDYLSNTNFGIYLEKATNENLQNAIFWGLSTLVSLPCLIAIYQKTKRASMVIIDLITKKSILKNNYSLRVCTIISNLISVSLILIIAIFITRINKNIIPPIDLLIFLTMLIFVLLALFFPRIINLHSKLKSSFFNNILRDNSENKEE